MLVSMTFEVFSSLSDSVFLYPHHSRIRDFEVITRKPNFHYRIVALGSSKGSLEKPTLRLPLVGDAAAPWQRMRFWEQQWAGFPCFPAKKVLGNSRENRTTPARCRFLSRVMVASSPGQSATG